ncbi:hypothetical protein BZA05DRAFT_471453, partial [Tricharina praecox]|uniref:uncharacterized protein n=1 Tax=Tricharina praecox TaxID=43433 RepID=UPI0022205885
MCPRHVGPPRPTRRHFGDLKRHPLLMRRFQPLLPRHFGGRSRRRHFAKCAGPLPTSLAVEENARCSTMRRLLQWWCSMLVWLSRTTTTLPKMR